MLDEILGRICRAVIRQISAAWRHASFPAIACMITSFLVIAFTLLAILRSMRSPTK